jgi:hypothetical protein
MEAAASASTDVRGGFPELQANPDIDAAAYYNSYLATYLERDVRALTNVGSLRDFERTSVGKVLSMLARRALNPARPQPAPSGFPVFAVPDGTPPLTPDMVRDALDEA